uniref:Intein-containing packaging ATPase n=1 Tax=Marseillevirus LCMAC101 TaxID=2506602 RepID=A0A481YRS3_9VIRU|nr:MAG: intein-containing packaging ATPase [Marseillevirus LCMAC101]
MPQSSVEIKEFVLEDIPMSCTWLIVGPPASGKCLAPGTPILMYDGTVKKVEDIRPGDVLMGDDSTPRRVLTICEGQDKMYRIKQNKGDDYIVNEPHILVLKRNYMPRITNKKTENRFKVFWMFNNTEKSKSFRYQPDEGSEAEVLEDAEQFLDSLCEGKDYTRENFLEISVRDYLNMPSSRRKKYKGFHVGVEFSDPGELPFDPHALGIWLGDGTSSKTQFTSADGEIVEYMRSIFKPYDLFVDRILYSDYDYRITSHEKGASKGVFGVDEERSKRNQFLNFLRDHNLLGNKHIPPAFKFSSRENRLKLLAGLIDTDGYLANESYYEIIQKNKTLAEDIAFVARSCGFYTSFIPCQKTCTNAPNGPVTGTYYRMNICGRSLHDIPVLLNRKKIKSEDSRTTDESVTGIEVEEIGIGTYHGFQIDGNKRFLLGDFTVTHNTSLIELFCYYLKHRYPVARVFMGTEGSYKKFCTIMPPLFVSLEFDEQEEKNHILRQRKCKIENPEDYPGNYAINIIDDASDDPKVYKTKVMKGLFKLGSQHWNQLLMVGSQYAIDLPPDIRKSVSYVAIFREPEEAERKKLHLNLGGSCGKYETFCELMDQITGDYTCMIIKKRSQSNKMEDNVFYMRTKVLKDWKFGCKEYREWGRSRYNSKFQDEIIV